jgi:ATP:corrinoid adenosyltransferase
MSLPYFGDKYDLTKLKQYVKEAGIIDKFTLQEQRDIQKIATELERILKEYEDGITRKVIMDELNAL